MKKSALSSLPLPYLALGLLLVAAVVVSLPMRKPDRASDILVPATISPNPSISPTNLTSAREALTSAQEAYKNALIERANDLSFIVASSTGLMTDKKLFVVHLGDARPASTGTIAEHCTDGCAYIVYNPTVGSWQELTDVELSRSYITSPPVWLTPDTLLFTALYGDAGLSAATYFTVDLNGVRRYIGNSEAYIFNQEDVLDPRMRPQISLTLYQGNRIKPSIHIRWSESDNRWIASVKAEREGGPMTLSTLLLPNPPTTTEEWGTGARLLPEPMARGEADIAFSWFGKTYVLNDTRLREQR